MKIREFTGKTTQEAIDAGLAEMGVTLSEVKIDVLQEGAKGLFGFFGSKPACVRMTLLDDETEDDGGLSDLLGSFSLDEKKPAPKKEAPAKQEAPAPKKEQPAPVKAAPAPKKEAPAKREAPAAVEAKTEPEAPAAETAPAAKPPRPPRQKKPREPKPIQQAAADTEKEYTPMTPVEPFAPAEPPVLFPEDTPAGNAQRFLMQVTSLMNVKVDVYVDDSKEDSLYIHMIGDTLGILIGRRGETLDALQYLTSLKVNKGREGYIRVTLDTENYRAKREDSLRRLALRMANRAVKTGRKVVLEPMNPYERRVLHTALQNHPSVTTHSEGEEPNRRVVILLKNAAAPEKTEKAGENAQEKPAKPHRRRHHGHRGPKPAAQNAEGVQAQETETAPAAEQE